MFLLFFVCLNFLTSILYKFVIIPFSTQMLVVLTVCIPGAYCPLAYNTNEVTSTSSVTSAELHLAFPKILLSVWFREETVQEKKKSGSWSRHSCALKVTVGRKVLCQLLWTSGWDSTQACCSWSEYSARCTLASVSHSDANSSPMASRVEHERAELVPRFSLPPECSFSPSPRSSRLLTVVQTHVCWLRP